MEKQLVATASITLNAPIAKIWDAITNPSVIKEYMFGTEVVSDWKVGRPILWKGVWKGKSYEDKGVILEIEPERLIRYSHFSPLSGAPDTPENYHTLTFELSKEGGASRLALSQDNNPDEKAREHSQKNWEAMLASLKKVVEK